jgi:alpha-beta hydrolase superfamily lysophospholipase
MKFSEPLEHNFKYEDIWFSSLDGTKLHGWYFPAKTKAAKGTIIQFHGNAQNISTHVYSLLWLTEEGYNLFTWDYRGYGKSQGAAYAEGIYYDSLAALEKGVALHKSPGPLVVYGQSLGGAIAVRALLDFKNKKKINFFVHDSSFVSYQDMAKDVLQRNWFSYLLSPLAYLLISDKYSAEDMLKKIDIPTLVIVGLHDKVVPANYGMNFFKEISSDPKWIWEIPSGEHINVFFHGQGEYRKKFLELLQQGF